MLKIKIIIRTCVFSLLIMGMYLFVFAEADFVYDAQNKRNPFIPLITPDGRLLKLDQEAGGIKDILLEGIIYDKNGLSYAIINAEVVRIGDSIGNYRVLKIEEKKIILIKEGEISEMELSKEEE